MTEGILNGPRVHCWWSQWSSSHNAWISPPSSCPPVQRAAANQQPLLIVYKHNTVRPAAFKSPCSIVLTTADQTTAPASSPTRAPTICTMNPIKGRESVCRSLFGPVDQEQLRRDLKQRLKEITEQDSRRWNFNFQADTPLPGRFQWEEVPADCAAALYQDPAEKMDTVCSPHTEHGDRLSDREESADTDQENRSSVSNTHKRPAEVTPVRRKRAHSRPAAKPRSRNARITGEEQVRQIRDEFNPVTYFYLNRDDRILIPLSLFFFFPNRFVRKEKEDDRNKERPESFPHKFQWGSSVQNNKMNMPLKKDYLFLYTLFYGPKPFTAPNGLYVMLCYVILFYFILFYFILSYFIWSYFIANFTPLCVIYFIYDVLFNFSACFHW